MVVAAVRLAFFRNFLLFIFLFPRVRLGSPSGGSENRAALGVNDGLTPPESYVVFVGFVRSIFCLGGFRWNPLIEFVLV